MIENSLCGERNCIMQLCAKYPKRNFLIEKVYIITDHKQPIGSGSLCLEFMSAMGTSDLKLICSNNNGDINKYQIGTLHQLYPFPSLCKLDPFPTQKSLLLFSEPIVSQTKHLIENINYQSTLFQNIVKNIDSNELEISPKHIKLLYNKLCKLASVTSHPKSSQLDLHPLNLHLGLLFNDGTYLFGKGCIAIEYSATMTVIDSIFHDILDCMELNSKIPVLMMILDQFGVLHTPQASTRSLFFENGLKKVKCLFHYVSEMSWNNPVHWYQRNYHHYFGLLNSLKYDLSTNKNENENGKDIKLFEKGYAFLNENWNELKFDLFCPTIEELLPAPSVDDMLENIASHPENKLKHENGKSRLIAEKNGNHHLKPQSLSCVCHSTNDTSVSSKL